MMITRPPSEYLIRSLQVENLDDLDPASVLGKQWEALVRQNAASGIMQSLHWRDMKLSQGLSSLHLGVFDNSELVGGVIFFFSQKRKGVRIMVAPEGPVLPWDNEPLSRTALGLLIQTAESYAQSLGAMCIRIEPRLPPPPMPLLREFSRAPADLIPQETLYIDLSEPVPAILSAMKPKARYNIGLARRRGVVVEKANGLSSVDRFYKVMQETSSRNRFAAEPYSFFNNLISTLCARNSAHLFFAEHEGDTLGALLLTTYGSRATYLYGGITNTKQNLMAGYALQWEAMQAAKTEGCTIYDFYGFDEFQSSEHNYARFSQFKKQFGGTVIRFIGAQDYFFVENLTDTFVRLVKEVGAAAEGGA
jgi:peptidoglycan pentaglycine glycine transferase (the first glycine)